MVQRAAEIAMARLKYWQACNEALRLEMRLDPSVIVLGEDVAGGAGREAEGIIDAWGGPFGFTRGLIQEFGADRVRDTPISEAAFVGLAAGLAAGGYRPWVDVMFTELLPLASDQLTNRIARTRFLSAGQLRMPLTIKTFGECYSPLCHYPGLICVAPSDAYSAKGLVTAAIRCDDPVIVFDSLRLLRHESEVPEGSYALDLGRSRVLREGADVTLLGIGPSTQLCLAVAARLELSSVSAEVVDLLTLSPWDVSGVVESVDHTGRLVVVDFDHPNCGLAATICATIGERSWAQLLAPPTRLCPLPLPIMGMDGNPTLSSLCLPSEEYVFRVASAILEDPLAGRSTRAGPWEA
jgi:pyruvate dehydrogenase E1 component beta subunit